jgi:hypothetical protein
MIGDLVCMRINFEAPLRSLAIPEIAHGRRGHALHSKVSIPFEKIVFHFPSKKLPSKSGLPIRIKFEAPCQTHQRLDKVCWA